MAGWTADWPGGISRTDSGVTYNYIQAWEFVAQAWFALRQRHAVLAGYVSPATQGLNTFPQPNPIWDRGTVDSITDNGDGTVTVTMSSVDWTHTWVGYSLSGCANAHIPSNYVLIIEPEPNVETLDPRLTVRGSITAYTSDTGAGTGTLTISRGSGQSLFPLDAVTAKYISSLSSLVGQNWYILQDEGWWCSERLPDRPDEQQLWVGDSSTGGNITVASHVVTVVAGSYSSDDLATLSVLPNGSYSTLTDAQATWSVDQWIATPAKEVIYWGSDSALHRDTITHNFGTILTFTNHSGWTAGGAYIIVPPGDLGYPGHIRLPIFQWNTGLGAGYSTHLADDSLGSWQLAAFFDNMPDGDNCSGECESTSVQVFDSSAQIDQFNDCAGTSAGLFLNPKVTKSLRYIQGDIIDICTNFLPYEDYSGVSIINLWTVATFFLSIGINAWDCGYTYVDSSHLTISGAPDGVEYPISCWYTVTNDGGSLSAGTGTLTDATTLEGSGFSDTSPLPTAVTIALGFSRYRPRHVRHFYPKTGFVPTYDEGIFDPPTVDFDDDGNVIDHTGQWVRRDKSTTYKSRSNIGSVGDGSVAFVDGELATHVGDNATEGCVFESDGLPIISSSGDSVLDRVPYYDHFYRGKYDTVLEQRRLASATGISTGGQNGTNNYALTDSTQNWWSDGINGSFSATSAGPIASVTVGVSAVVTATVPSTAVTCTYVVVDGSGNTVLEGSSAVVSGSSVTLSGAFTTPMVGFTCTMTFQGSLHIDSGTATSGSTTSLTDSSHNTTGSTNPLSCWWANTRFLDFSDPSAYTDFVLVISHSGNTWRVPITSTTSGAGGVTFNFTAVTGLTVASGYTWSLTEPAYEINKWEGRTVSMVNPSTKAIYQAIITHSNDNTIFFGQVYDSTGTAASVTLGSGWSYTIDDRRFGGVWRWDADGGLGGIGAWIKPTGDDVGRMGNGGSPQPFKDDQTMNLPTVVKDYGKIMVDDFMCVEIFTEIQTAINAMIATKAGGTFCAGRTETMEDYLVEILGSTGDERNYDYPLGDDGTAAWDYAYGSYLLSIANQLDGGVDEISGDPWPGPEQGNIDTVSHPCKVYDSFFGEGAPTEDVEGGGEILSEGVSETGYAKATNVCTLFPSSWDAYVRATIDAADEAPYSNTVDNIDTVIEFDPTDNPVEYHIFTKVSSDTASSDGPVRVSETKLGDLSTNIPAVFRSIGLFYDKVHGWYAPDPTLIFKWEFTYVAA